jgi:LacI family transcriptional regulator
LSATIYDIAKEAGVSIATVSRVFNNNKNVSDKTRKRILGIADAMGYHPKAFAQGLARRNTKIIMALVPVISNYFFMEVLAGIQDKLTEFDYDLNIYNIKANVDLVQQVEYVLRKGMGDGYLFISIHLEESLWESLKRYDVPITLMDEYHTGFDSVSVDSVEGAYTATQYLLNQNYKQVAMISALPQAKPTRDRVLGYKRALEDAGYLVDEELIVRGDDPDRDGFTEKAGYEAMAKLLNSNKNPEACFSASDIQAVGAMKAMRDFQKRIPMISFDDIQISEYLGLSTMRQPMYEMGALAVDKLMNRIRNRKAMISHTVFSPELIIRDSASENVNEKII